MKRKSIPVKVDDLTIGGGAPVVVQSMTDTPTAEIDQTVEQIVALSRAGSELVRITVNTEEAAAVVPEIKATLAKRQCFVPLVGDFHYNGHLLLEKYPECAKALSKYRINPGNSRDQGFSSLIKTAIAYNKPLRIGVNGGSLDQKLLAELMDQNAASQVPEPAHLVTREALIQSALRSARAAEHLGLPTDKIILSCKVSQVPELIAIYQVLSERSPYALHLGLTESGQGPQGIVSSSIGIGVLLEQGIGDTIRVSITPGPGEDRTGEVYVAQQILQTLDLRRFRPTIISCPGCGRTTSNEFRQMALDVDSYVTKRLPEWIKTNPEVASLKIAVMGCIVNGPGESRDANIGIFLPGQDENRVALVNIDGSQAAKLQGDNLTKKFTELLEKYVVDCYRPGS